MDFASDNAVGASPRVLDALPAAHQGTASAHDADPLSARARQLLNEVFERDVPCSFVLTGTSANALAIGALYTRDERAALSDITRSAGVRLHIDDARVANALAALRCAPAEMSWKAGVDVLSSGATKNGAIACEAIFFDPKKAAACAYQCKRAGHTLSKRRLLGVQMASYLEGDHWLALARTAHDHATDLAQGLTVTADVRLTWDAPACQLFAIIPRVADPTLKQAGARYYDWGERSDGCKVLGTDEVFVRPVTSLAIMAEAVRCFVAMVHAAQS